MKLCRYHSKVTSFALLFALLATAAAGAPQEADDSKLPEGNLYVGDKKPTAESLEPRAKAQIDSATKELEVFHGFKFEDRYLQSGITWRHKPTDDGMKHYSMVHYDHGNGILVADVDGDGLYDIYFISQFGLNELWRNLGGGKFENITDKAGLSMSGLISVTGAFADVDNDGDADLYMTTVRTGEDPNRLSQAV